MIANTALVRRRADENADDFNVLVPITALQ